MTKLESNYKGGEKGQSYFYTLLMTKYGEIKTGASFVSY